MRGVAAGTVVMTADGALPVEYLLPDDRVVTRAGLARVAGLRVGAGLADIVRIAPSAFGHDRPEDDVVMAAGQPVLIRDWRAGVPFGTAPAILPVGLLADGRVVRRDRAGVRLFEVLLSAPAVLQAGGMEIACEGARVTA